VGQLASCHNYFRLGFAVTAHHVGSTWQPVPRACPDSTSNSPRGLGSMSVVAHPMEGPTGKMDCLWFTHSTGQPNLRISPLYGTLSPMGPSHPTSRVTSNSTGHTLWVGASYRVGRSMGTVSSYRVSWLSQICPCNFPWGVTWHWSH